jgi:hypothetical protein
VSEHYDSPASISLNHGRGFQAYENIFYVSGQVSDLLDDCVPPCSSSTGSS